jgi:hypothetical protein
MFYLHCTMRGSLENVCHGNGHPICSCLHRSRRVFPNLVMHVYRFVVRNAELGDDSRFARYFTAT